MDIRSFFKSKGRPEGADNEVEEVAAPEPSPKKRKGEASQKKATKRLNKGSKTSARTPKANVVFDVDEGTIYKDETKPRTGRSKHVVEEVEEIQAVEKPRKRRRKEPAASKKEPTSKVDTFVFTGVLTRPGTQDVLPREEAVEMVVELGARCTSAVSSKTTYLVTGETLEDGRPYTEGKKYKKAVTLASCTIMKPDDFFSYVEERKKQLKPEAEPSLTSMAWQDSIVSSQKTLTPGKKKSPLAPDAKVVYDEGSLWVDKYQPRVPEDLVGNGKALNDLVRWLQSWHAMHVTEEKAKPKGKQNPGAKAALLSGPPGIGKSTMARLVAAVCGYTIYELNASDKRSKRLLHDALRDALQSSMIQLHDDGSTGLQRRCVVMDEVDGMSAGDRGGTQELIALLKSTKVPVIAICNDRQSQKVRTLANHCYDLRLQRPSAQQITRRMMQVASKEGMAIEEGAAYAIAETTGGDVRQSIHALQMHLALDAEGTVGMSVEQAKKRIKLIAKDNVLRLTPSDACRQIVSETSRPLSERMDAFFVDYQLVPLLVAQHYVASINQNRRPGFGDKAEALAKASEALSDAELVTSMIRGDNQNWSLLPTSALLHCRVGSFCGGGIGFAGFPEWLGKNSTRTKRKRIANELGARLAHHAKRSNRQGLVMDVAEVLRERLLRPLLDGGDAALAVVEDLEALGLNRDDLFETIKELQWSTVADDKNHFQQLGSKAKSAFTRAYNKKHNVKKQQKS